MGYKAEEYWEARLRGSCSVAGTGHLGFGERYNGYMYRLRTRVLEKALKRYRVAVEGRSVLEVGCGGGFFVDFYKRKGAGAVTGIDITETSVNAMRRKFPSYEFFRNDIGQPHVSLGKTFDIINIFDVLYHIADDDAFGNAVANIGTWSKKGSWIFISDSLDPSGKTAEHVRYRSLEAYAAALKREDIDIAGTLPIFHLMGRSVGQAVRDSVAGKMAARAVESLAWLSYCADIIYCPLKSSTMRLLVCRKR